MPTPQVAQERPPTAPPKGAWCTLALKNQREPLSFSHHKPLLELACAFPRLPEFLSRKGMCRPSDLGNTQSLQSKLDGPGCAGPRPLKLLGATDSLEQGVGRGAQSSLRAPPHP